MLFSPAFTNFSSHVYNARAGRRLRAAYTATHACDAHTCHHKKRLICLNRFCPTSRHAPSIGSKKKIFASPKFRPRLKCIFGSSPNFSNSDIDRLYGPFCICFIQTTHLYPTFFTQFYPHIHKGNYIRLRLISLTKSISVYIKSDSAYQINLSPSENQLFHRTAPTFPNKKVT